MSYLSEAFALLFDSEGELLQIIGVTMRMSFFGTLISCALGIPLGVWLGTAHFRGRKLVLRIVHTLMGLPPVVAGLIVFLILSNRGPLGQFRLLFTVTAMVIAQVVLITPVVMGLSASFVTAKAPAIRETAHGVGIRGWRYGGLLLWECRAQLVSVVLTAFGRTIAEVGAVSMVGGNVRYKTRVMTTAIVLESNKGNFEFAVALGVVLLLIALVVNLIAGAVTEDRHA